MLQTVDLTVLGAGSWGTALAIQLARNGHRVRLWGRDPEHLAMLAAERCNRRYLPDCPLPDGVQPQPDLALALDDSALALLVVPSHAFSAMLDDLRPRLGDQTGFAWASKGLDRASGRFLHQVVVDKLGPERPVAVVSGPSFAAEVAAGLPTAISVTAADPAYTHWLATLLHGDNMLAYTGTDLIGVELGGAVKNVLAIAAGVSDGLGLGANARAALITRGLAELRRLGAALGAEPDTLMGLTGVGDLLLTCTDDLSRNRRFGLALGRGESAEQAKAAIGQVVEGALAAREIMRLARAQAVPVAMPICEQVERIIDQRQEPRAAVAELLARSPGPE